MSNAVRKIGERSKVQYPAMSSTTNSSDKEQKQQSEYIEISTNSNKRQKITTTTPNASSFCSALSHSWPLIDPTPSRYQFKENSGLLYGLDNELWMALGYLDPNDFLNTSKGKQVIIRKALNLLNLGWIATNIFPFRGPIGKKFDTAKQMHIMSNNNIGQKPLNNNNMIPPPFLTPKTISVEDRKLGKDGECVLDIFSAVVNPLENLKNVNNIKATIEKYGVAVIRSALPKLRLAARGGAADHGHEQQQQQQQMPPKPKRQRVVKIQHTTGNGIAGFCSNSNNGESSVSPSYYGDLGSRDVKTSNNDSNTILDDVEYWADVQARILRCFLHKNNNNNKHDHSVNELLKKRKAIFLKYSEGAENWAHRDGSIDDDDVFPYQAMVMLSEPGKDFTGGEFYVASKRIISSSNKDVDIGDDGGGNSSNNNYVHHILRTYVEFYNQGDLVIFQASKEGGYDHGMLTVQKGSAATKCERIAIGMFQKA